MFPAVRTRPLALVTVVLFAVMVIVAAQLVTSRPVTSQAPLHAQRVATTAPTAATTTTTAPAPAPAPATVAAAPAPAASDPGVVPPIGRATAWGCGAALSYLQAYAAKGFALECPGYAEGREAMTCMNQAGACPGTSVIAVADPCPQAYMNEASNSYVIKGVADTPIDPFGPCP